MVLSNIDLESISGKMGISNFKGVYSQDTLPPIEPNSSYVINLQTEKNDNGEYNEGTHWCAIVSNDKKQAVYFDSYGEGPPKATEATFNTYGYKIAHCQKNVQSLLSDICGFFSMAFIYFLNVYKQRTGDIFTDASIFLDLFEDLDKVDDIKKNEFILSMFFTNAKTGEMLFGHNNVDITEDNHIKDSFDIEDKLLRP